MDQVSYIPAMPCIPLSDEECSLLRKQVGAAMDFCWSWDGLICLERCGEEMILIPYRYYKQRYSDFDEVPPALGGSEETRGDSTKK